MIPKILFLDIDGVLNNRFHEYTPRVISDTLKGHGREDLDPRAIDLLNILTETTKCKIVISSSWRIGETIDSLQKKLQDNGLIANIHGFTKSLGSYRVRGNEIRAYLEDNFIYGDEYLYAILDDDSDMLLEQANNFFHVDGYSGITPNTVYKLTNHFGSEISNNEERELWNKFYSVHNNRITP